jgi:nucleoside-diphosphate-sugar epimerase
VKILVTGASGFVGQALTRDLAAAGHQVRAASRRATAMPQTNIEPVVLPDLNEPVDWAPLLDGIDAVVHLAGIAHAGPGIAEDRYDRVNRAATTELAAASKRAGITRFVFMSSIRAQSGPTADHVLTEADVPIPTDPYGRSKLAAEQAVTASGLSYVNLRPVLIYGPGVKGNLAGLMRLAALPVPLPFGAFANRRSLLSLDNLTGAIRHVLATPEISGSYIVADRAPITLAEIIAALRAGLGRQPGLLNVPPAWFRAALTALGREAIWQRLGGAFVADPAQLIATGWQPLIETPKGLQAMAAQAAAPRKSGTASVSTR